MPPDYLIGVRYLEPGFTPPAGSSADVLCAVCLPLCWRSRSARLAQGHLPVLYVQWADKIPSLRVLPQMAAASGAGL